jgi:hypothetical protein
MNDREIRVTADWRKEPDLQLLAQALFALARDLDGVDSDDASPEEPS